MKSLRITIALAVALAALRLTVVVSTAAPLADPAQQKAEAILQRADAKVAALRDFKANLQARAHLSLLPAMDVSGHVYFKRPNHLKVDVDRLPRVLSQVRQQMMVEPPYQNRKKYAPRWVREEVLDGHPCDVIVFQARDASTRLQAATIWLDRSTDTVPRSLLDYADGSHAEMSTRYSKTRGFMLPSHSDIEMQMSALHVTADVSYSDYVVNTNLPDSIFAPK